MGAGRKKGRFGSNMILYNMGVDIDVDSSVLQVKKAIDLIDRTFHVVLIAEKLEESLILLKEKLCWSYMDILYFDQNRKSEHDKSDIKSRSRLMSKLETLNSADVLLYEHFLSKHDDAVKKYGTAEMALQVEYFKTFKGRYRKKCVAEKDKKIKDKIDYQVMDDCRLLNSTETHFINLVRKKQMA